MKNYIKFSVLLISLFTTISGFSASDSPLTVEELRIAKASMTMPVIFRPLKNRVDLFKSQVSKARNFTALTQLVIRHGDGVWLDGVRAFENMGKFDDRSLYWARLQMSTSLKKSKVFNQLLVVQQQKLLWQLELLSRGSRDVKFNKNSNKKILVTGFDPFFLDKHIDQSNPAGVVALALDDLLISKDGQSAEIETLILPVRFADFDKGMVEELLRPYYRSVDMIVTVSMGRENFDLERFPGLNRSAQAPDNVNSYTGASPSNPLKPLLDNKPLKGPEFLSFSLPAESMMQANGDFMINDNATVTTTDGKITVEKLSDLNNKVSVNGSGGGYLSNEISYRSLLLRDQYNPVLSVGHIHTPRIVGYKPKTSEKIVKQIKQMLTLSIDEI